MEELQTYRAEFETITQNYVYLNHAAVSPLPKRTVQGMQQFLEQRRDHGGVWEDTWWQTLEETRNLIAQLLHAKPEEIALTKSTSDGLLILSTGWPWRAGDQILLIRDEFPALYYPWVPLRDQGVEIRWVEPRDGPLLAQIEKALTPRTRWVVVSWVDYLTGRRLNLGALTEIVHRIGAYVAVDGIQGLGALPLDVQKSRIDLLVAGGPKWLFGPMATGFLYLRQEILENIKVRLMGWLSVEDFMDFDTTNHRLRPGAQRFEYATYHFLGITGLKISLRWLLEIGLHRIADRIRDLTTRLMEGIADLGLPVLTPSPSTQRAGIVTCQVPGNPETILQTLQREKIIVALRKGYLRISPHFYNTEEEIERLLDVLKQML